MKMFSIGMSTILNLYNIYIIYINKLILMSSKRFKPFQVFHLVNIVVNALVTIVLSYSKKQIFVYFTEISIF